MRANVGRVDAALEIRGDARCPRDSVLFLLVEIRIRNEGGNRASLALPIQIPRFQPGLFLEFDVESVT